MICSRCGQEKDSAQVVKVFADNNCSFRTNIVCRPCVTPEEWAESKRADAVLGEAGRLVAVVDSICYRR